MAANILSNHTALWLNIRWGLPDTWDRIPPFSKGALSSRPNPAHRPKVGRQQLFYPAPMGLCSSLGNAWSILAVTCVPSCVWRRSSIAVLLTWLHLSCTPASVIQLYTPGFSALALLKISAQDVGLCEVRSFVLAHVQSSGICCRGLGLSITHHW